MPSGKSLETLSAAMDSEATEAEIRSGLDAAKKDPELRAAWRRYHAIGAALRGELHPGADAMRERVWNALQSESSQAADEVGEENPPMRSRRRVEGVAFLAGFVLSIPIANWMIGNVGADCDGGGGPCLIPVLPGVMAPSSVLVLGLIFVLRDLVQRRLGVHWAIGAIVAGAALSAFVASPTLVLASATAFLISEFCDLLVYTPLQRRRMVLAVFASSIVGLVVDSLLFLSLAYGSLELLAGLIVGKSWGVLLVMPLIGYLRRRDERIGLQPA